MSFGTPLNDRLGCFSEGDSHASSTEAEPPMPVTPPPPYKHMSSERTYAIDYCMFNICLCVYNFIIYHENINTLHDKSKRKAHYWNLTCQIHFHFWNHDRVQFVVYGFMSFSKSVNYCLMLYVASLITFQSYVSRGVYQWNNIKTLRIAG